MNYAFTHFNKSLNELTFHDVEHFFENERTETDQIEFKSITPQGSLQEKFKGVQRSICAFLNSSGGLIIWGSPKGEKVDGRKEKIFKGNLTGFDETIEKDYLVSKISDSIIPLPNNIRFQILSNENKTVVVIEIDASEYSPHQTEDTYYMRIDGQTKPAPHHYIEALFKKIRYPNIEGYLKIKKVETIATANRFSKYKLTVDFIFFNFSPLQNEEKLSFRVVIGHALFERFQYLDTQHFYSGNGTELTRPNAKDIFHFGEPFLEEDILLFNPYQLNENGNKAHIIITFSGRFSPMKTSVYTLDFNKMHSPNPNEMIIHKEENTLFKEKSKSREEVIEAIMKQGLNI